MKGIQVCLLSTGQPSTNPRLVKEADALSEAGYRVQVLCGVWADWAVQTDRALLSSRAWKCRYVGGNPHSDRLRYYWSRLRYSTAQRLAHLPSGGERWMRWGLSRVGAELRLSALSQPSHLYIAHYPGALVAAAAAARRWGARLGFDLEDIYSDGYALNRHRLALIEQCERRFLPDCHFTTAASPLIGRVYCEKYGIREPVSILNVFPLGMRPAQFPRCRDSGPLELYWFSQTIGAGRGLELVLEAMSRATAETRLHLRGEWQEGYRARLHSLAAARGLEASRLVWHPPGPPDEMARLASAFDIGLAVEPGRDLNNQLTISNKIFTYLLAGVAVVATQTPGQQDLCRQLGQAAFNFPGEKPEALARQLEYWYQDRSALEQARRKAWEMGEKRFNWDQEKQRFLTLVEQTLN